MTNQEMLSMPTYNPSNLLDAVIEKLGLRNDSHLSHRLETTPPQISKLRNKRLPLGDVMLVRLHEETGFSIRELRQLAGIEARKIEFKRAA
jgi:hypothetical protein